MNRLQFETSPYLRQHAHNPVDWYAWKPEAFERARAEDKPILVSIGYSTCHWCHVMERESFEKADVAKYMNEHFINIKVDREERPDVDAIYMEACQLLTGGGGWPLNCFLTPDARPFFAGTYYPPRPAYGRPSWMQLLEHLSAIWESQRPAALEQADKLLGYLQRSDENLVDRSGDEQDPLAPRGLVVPTDTPGFGADLLEAIYYRLRERFDRVEGGFGDAPKFPGSMVIQFLLRYHHYTGSAEALEQARLSLDKMIQGGIYDQLGGGFARYATDREWLIPHFEKMLYDNALLVVTLAEAYKLTGDDLYRETIEETLEYVKREMTHPDGGFYSALDADSEGEEGKFYVWTKAEVEAALGDDAPLFCAFYDVTEGGNWEHKNILRRPRPFEAFAVERGLEVSLLKAQLQRARTTLFRRRANRIPPGLDDKVLLGWNALMISAYAAAYSALGQEAYRAAARRAAEFLENELSDGQGGFLHSWKDGQAQYGAFLDDYAYVIAAWIDLYEITFEPAFLTQAEKYLRHVLSYFDDTDTGLFFFTQSGQSDVILRKKDLYDNATPSGNSTMALNLQRLGILFDEIAWRERASTMLLRLRPTIEQYPNAFARWAMALTGEIHPGHEIAVVGADAKEKAFAIDRHFLPNRVLAAAAGPDDRFPLLAGKPGSDPALIYVCRNYACQRPVETLEAFRDLVGLPAHDRKNQP